MRLIALGEGAGTMRKRRPFTVNATVVALSLVFPALLLAASPDEMKRHALETIDRNADQIALLGDSLFYFGELGMQEFESTKLVKETLEGAGFAVEMGGAGMPTALWARWGTGSRSSSSRPRWMRSPRAHRRRASSTASHS
jgi:hypothetical protein